MDAPDPGYGSSAQAAAGQRRVTPPRGAYLTPESHNPLNDLDTDAEFGDRQRRRGMSVRFEGGLMPHTTWGRVAAASGLLCLAAVGIAALLVTRGYILRDDHFALVSPSSIQIVGNAHLTRPQLLSVFGGDVERNVFALPLAERRVELERLPWVGHATVMRLLPNRIRVAIVERTPVAFVREGSRIGLVDATGVLLDMAPGEEEEGAAQPHPATYSFPVLTGISPSDPASTRAARMKIYTSFVAALDASGDRISRKLSEVDLTNPEDVKAILPEHGVDVLVHFGDERYLERYRKFEQHLPDWRQQYPRLASVDMRYERQVVLEMAPGTAVPQSPADKQSIATNAVPDEPRPTAKAEPKSAIRPSAKPATLAAQKPRPVANAVKPALMAGKPAAATAGPTATAKPTTVPSKTPPVVAPAATPAAPTKQASDTTTSQHLTTAFPVPSSAGNTPKQAAIKPVAAKPLPATRPAAASPLQGAPR